MISKHFSLTLLNRLDENSSYLQQLSYLDTSIFVLFYVIRWSQHLDVVSAIVSIVAVNQLPISSLFLGEGSKKVVGSPVHSM